jgi:hypothetical protein
MKIVKEWNHYCEQDIFFVQNKDGVFVWCPCNQGGITDLPSKKGVRTYWRKCNFNTLSFLGLGYRGTTSSELEFLVLTGQTIEESLKRDYYESKAS